MDINRTTRTIAVDCRKVWTFVFSQLNSRQLHRITSHFLSVKRKSHSKNAEFLRNRIKMFALTPYRTDRALSNFANDTSYQQFLNREQKMIEVWKNRNSVFNRRTFHYTIRFSPDDFVLKEKNMIIAVHYSKSTKFVFSLPFYRRRTEMKLMPLDKQTQWNTDSNLINGFNWINLARKFKA